MYTAKITAPYSEELFEALIPERNNKNDRCTLNIKKSGSKLLIELKSKDATALRAFLTGITRLLGIYEKIRSM